MPKDTSIEHQKPGIDPATVQMPDEYKPHHRTHGVFSEETEGLVWFHSDADVSLCSFGQGRPLVIHNLAENKHGVGVGLCSDASYMGPEVRLAV